MLDHFQMGPNLVRGFAPLGIGPRDITPGTYNDALGGTKYWGASVELQMPFWFLPKEIGLKGAVYADAGSLFDYKGSTCWVQTAECLTVGADDGLVRTSVGVGLIWQSPFGPLRFGLRRPSDEEQVRPSPGIPVRRRYVVQAGWMDFAAKRVSAGHQLVPALSLYNQLFLPGQARHCSQKSLTPRHKLSWFDRLKSAGLGIFRQRVEDHVAGKWFSSSRRVK